MKYIVTMNGKKYEVGVERYSPFHMLSHEEVARGGSLAVETPVSPSTVAQASVPLQTASVAASPKNVEPERKETSSKKGSAKEIVCPMYGSIVDIRVGVGQSVNIGDTVFMIEAMKMETEIVASASGTIAEIRVKAGDTVETDQVLAIIK